MMSRFSAICMFAALVLGASAGAFAQDGSTPSGTPNPSGTTSSVPGSANRPPTEDSDSAPAETSGDQKAADSEDSADEAEASDASGREWSATVRVTDGLSEEPIADETVTLTAFRPSRRPQRQQSELVETWETETDSEGLAQFDGLAGDLLEERLGLFAEVKSSGITFRSRQKLASEGVELRISTFPTTENLDDVFVERLRTVIEPWEDYAVVVQYWDLTVKGDRAIDTRRLEGEDFKHGLPLELPTDAKGIHLNGPGESKIIDSTAHWKGVLRPNRSTQLRLRFSMSANSPELTYRQKVDYPVQETEFVVPLQTKYDKVPRLDNATLAAPGFERVEATTEVPDFRTDNEYLYASGKSLDAGETFVAHVTGLPFERPAAPWITLGLGLFGMGLIVAFARRETARFESDEATGDAIQALEEEREQLLEELAELQRAYEEDAVTEITYETESLHLRERLSLIMKKLRELRETSEPDGNS